MSRVLNARRVGARSTKTRVYVGRPSKWGNPFVIGPDGSREDVVSKYRLWIREQPELIASIGELIGMDLVCWCEEWELCHARDVLLPLVKGIEAPNVRSRPLF